MLLLVGDTLKSNVSKKSRVTTIKICMEYLLLHRPQIFDVSLFYINFNYSSYSKYFKI
jgi:hypothetical protein